MMLTRCPACTTTFRVTPEQLKTRRGKVRCGQCTTVFNALDSLVEESVPGEAGPTQHAFVPDALHAASALESPPAVDGPPAAPAHIEEPRPVEVIPQQFAPEELSTAEQHATWAPPEAESEAPEIAAPATPDELVVEHLEAEPQIHEAPPAPALIIESAMPVATQQIARQNAPAPTDMRAAFGLPTHAPDADTPMPSKPRARTALWIAAAALAGLALVGQIALHFRVELAQRHPALKPAMLAVCRMLGCEIPLPQQPTLLSLEGSNLYPDPDHQGQLILVATIRNRASFAQQFPYLELSLTDVNNRRLAVRAFKPGEYLQASTDPAKGLAADEEITANLTLDPLGLPVAGYLVYIFYP